MASKDFGNGAVAGQRVTSGDKIARLGSVMALEEYTEETRRPTNPIMAIFHWYFRWAIPGLGMFSEAYVVFALGQLKPFQQALYPSCFKTNVDCTSNLVKVQNYIQICGIIAGMLFFGALGDFIGRKWGSRIVSSIMLMGAIILIFTPLTPQSEPLTYLQFYIFAQTFYGFGVGGEYPMASSSAAERSQADPSLRLHRGRQVVLTFSNQGMGNFVNGCVILIAMAIFGQTGKLDPIGSRNVIILQFAVGAAVCLFMVGWRYTMLNESKVWSVEKKDVGEVAKSPMYMYWVSLKYFWPRLLVTCLAWVANDFAFYGNKLFQSTFITLLYPNDSQYEKQQWTILNSAVALCGYWLAALLIDYPWYGRRRMQNTGFLMMFILFGICAIAFPSLTSSDSGLHGFQFLYFFSSFWNQFGPNCTTWLVAAEVYPTEVRATFQGFSAAMGKVGAIISDVIFGYVSQRVTFLLSAVFGLLGFVVTFIFLPDTTGMSLDENDRMHKYMLAGEVHDYHGEGFNPKHLSPWEIYVLKWGKQYDPAMDAKHKALQVEDFEIRSFSKTQVPGGVQEIRQEMAAKDSAV